MKVLVVGGAGYIGSTVTSACLDAGHDVVVMDDLSTGRREFTDGRTLIEADFADRRALDEVFSAGDVDAVVHCAAKIVVPESVAEPLAYFENNVGKTLDLLTAMADHGVNRLLFSSSASIYAPDDNFTVTEDSPIAPASPYARTKAMMEQVFGDVAAASALRVLSLRYFNPIGTDPRLRTGQQIEHPTHVMGKLLDAWLEERPFTVTGVKWPTRDGSGIRDFIHVWDLAKAHVAALERFDQVTGREPAVAINLGTGRGVTVRELVAAFEAATGKPLEVVEGPPRPGDVAGTYTVSDRAARLLGWRSELTEVDGVRDAIAWLPVRKQKLGY